MKKLTVILLILALLIPHTVFANAEAVEDDNPFKDFKDYSYSTNQKHTPLAHEDKYFYSLLDEKGKKYYRELYEVAEAVEEKAVVFESGTEYSYISMIRDYLLHDNPQIYYTYGGVNSKQLDGTIEFTFGYAFDRQNFSGYSNPLSDELKKKILDKKTEFNNKVSEFISVIPTDAPDIIKEKLIYAKILKESYYNLGAQWPGVYEDNWSPYGIICNGYGVCESYSEAFQTLLHAVGIPCAPVVGTAGGGHKWNVVKIGGQWYQCDITFDDPIGGDPNDAYSYYFNLTDEEMARDHDWSFFEYELPECNSTKYGRDIVNKYLSLVDKTVHVFKNRCAKKCNNCDYEKDYVPSHEYENDESVECIYCGHIRPKGWTFEDGSWYYYKAGSRLYNQWIADSVGLVYLDYDGKMATNRFVYGDTTYYVGADGYIVKNAWVYEYSQWYYMDENGEPLNDQWLFWNGDWYHFDFSGVMETDVHCYDSVGEVFIGADGRMLKSVWYYYCGYWYYLDENGYVVKDRWMRDSVGWCYLTSDGTMATNMWVMDSVGWCYVGSDGYCLTDAWKTDSSGNLFYLNRNGNMATNQWVYTGNAWYYFNEYGFRLRGNHYIDGTLHHFDYATGVWLGEY